jgi:hypothetical protein
MQETPFRCNIDRMEEKGGKIQIRGVDINACQVLLWREPTGLSRVGSIA